MTDGPQGPVIDGLADLHYELMVLNEQIRQLVSLEARDIPAPVVNVAPTPITLPEPREAVSTDLTPVLAALQQQRPDNSEVVAGLQALKDTLTAQLEQARAAGMSAAYGPGGGGSNVTVNGSVPVTWAEGGTPLQVTVTNPSGGSSGGLTDTELRATPVPVSGTVTVSNPTTNPETGLAKDVTFAKDADGGIKAHVQNFPATQAVSGSVSVTGTVPVSGTFWQATQPVSLATNTPDVTDRAARLLGHVTIDNASLTVSNGQTQPLTDTQLRATAVPVSGTVTANIGTGSLAGITGTVTVKADTAGNQANALKVDGSATTQPVSGTVTAAQAAPASLQATVAQLTLTKGTQGGTGVTTQDLKDAGRSSKTMFSAFTSTATAETSVSFQVSSAGGAPAVAATSYTVTSGKTLRIQSIHAVIRAAGSTPAASLATFKMKVGGNQQGIAYTVAAPTTVAAGPAAFVGLPLTIPDGLELAAGSVLSFTLTLSAWSSGVNTPVCDLTVIGYEY